jgi:hypothetical protein
LLVVLALWATSMPATSSMPTEPLFQVRAVLDIQDRLEPPAAQDILVVLVQAVQGQLVTQARQVQDTQDRLGAQAVQVQQVTQAVQVLQATLVIQVVVEQRHLLLVILHPLVPVLETYGIILQPMRY